MSTTVADSGAHPVTQAAVPPAVLPLENGDRSTRDEFERRYAALPHVKKAELIEGVVHMPSPIRSDAPSLACQPRSSSSFQMRCKAGFSVPAATLGDDPQIRARYSAAIRAASFARAAM